IAVEVLHLAFVDHGPVELLARPECAFDLAAGSDVAEGGAHEGVTLTGFDVLEIDHLEEPLGERQAHAVFQFVGAYRHMGSSEMRSDAAFLWVCVTGRQPSEVTTTVSSMRTPPWSGR